MRIFKISLLKKLNKLKYNLKNANFQKKIIINVYFFKSIPWAIIKNMFLFVCFNNKKNLLYLYIIKKIFYKNIQK